MHKIVYFSGKKKSIAFQALILTTKKLLKWSCIIIFPRERTLKALRHPTNTVMGRHLCGFFGSLDVGAGSVSMDLMGSIESIYVTLCFFIFIRLALLVWVWWVLVWVFWVDTFHGKKSGYFLRDSASVVKARKSE